MEGKSNGATDIRVWMDGCFDMLHVAHVISFVKAKQMGDALIVGMQSDATIRQVKGPPVYTEQERAKLLRGLKSIEQVVEDVPYGTTVDTLDKYNCHLCAHGDDSAIAAKEDDILRELMKINRMRFFKRSDGVSTSYLIDRILSITKQDKGCTKKREFCDIKATLLGQLCQGSGPRKGQRIVYTSGFFDLFHAGHQDFLEKAAALGDYLIVGLYNDETSHRLKGPGRPVLSLMERAVRLLACKCVDDVILNVPAAVTRDWIEHNEITVVCHGKTTIVFQDEEDPFKAAKKMKVFTTIDSGNPLRTKDIFQRIENRRAEYEERNKKKREKNDNGSLYVQKKGNNLVAVTSHVGKQNTTISI